jgi:hypothetical protein
MMETMTKTMTETVPDTMSKQVFVSTEILASIYSLTNFADIPRNGTPILCGVQLIRTSGGRLVAYATNRYVLARGTYDSGVGYNGWGIGQTLWIDVATLKQAVAIAKNYKTPIITIGYNNDNEAFIDVEGNKLFNVLGQPSYPNVEAMFDDDAMPNGADVIRINPKWLALLSKVITPTTRQNKDLPWVLSFFHDTESKKPKPMRATLEETNWNISVLIQPNLLVR